MKKRGLPEGYVRGLEKLWGLAIRDVDAVEDNVLMALVGDEDSRKSPVTLACSAQEGEVIWVRFEADFVQVPKVLSMYGMMRPIPRIWSKCGENHKFRGSWKDYCPHRTCRQIARGGVLALMLLL